MRLGAHSFSSVVDCTEDEKFCADPAIDVGIAEVIEHENYEFFYPPDYTASRNNDIGLIRLNRKVTYTDFIRPICLPPRNLEDAFFDGADLVLSSWGRTTTKPGKKNLKNKEVAAL